MKTRIIGKDGVESFIDFDDYAATLNGMIEGNGIPPGTGIKTLEKMYNVKWNSDTKQFKNLVKE